MLPAGRKKKCLIEVGGPLSSELIMAGLLICVATPSLSQKMPPPEPMPTPPAHLPEGSVIMQDPATAAIWHSDFPIAEGPYGPSWESIAKQYPGTPAWLREAKFGIWVHFGPQSEGQSGDWYARKLYEEGTVAYKNHLRDFGHPSETGYMDVLHAWNPAKLRPDALVALYKHAGARFVLVQGVHHDNFDNWDSTYQPWNSMTLLHRDLLGEWSHAAKAEGLRFGVAFHHDRSWLWYQSAFGSDRTGPKAGVPYDAAHLTAADGKGKWWHGLDPALLYGVDMREYKDIDVPRTFAPAKGIFQNHQEFAHWYVRRWALRIEDVINKYDPDFIYNDGDSAEPFNGMRSESGIKTDAMARVVSDYYNKALERRGKVDVFSVVKFHPPCNGIVSTAEGHPPRQGIKTDQDWLGEAAVGDWFWRPDIQYDAASVERFLLEMVSRDGAFVLNITIRPDGSLDTGAVTMLKELGAWMAINGEGIYGSHAWKQFGEGQALMTRMLTKGEADSLFHSDDFRFTQGKDGSLYIFAMQAPSPGKIIRVRGLGSRAKLWPAAPKEIILLGSEDTVTWKQTEDALEIQTPPHTSGLPIIAFRMR